MPAAIGAKAIFSIVSLHGGSPGEPRRRRAPGSRPRICRNRSAPLLTGLPAGRDDPHPRLGCPRLRRVVSADWRALGPTFSRHHRTDVPPPSFLCPAGRPLGAFGFTSGSDGFFPGRSPFSCSAQPHGRAARGSRLPIGAALAAVLLLRDVRRPRGRRLRFDRRPARCARRTHGRACLDGARSLAFALSSLSALAPPCSRNLRRSWLSSRSSSRFSCSPTAVNGRI